MSGKCVLAVDVGTSALKAALVSFAGDVLYVARQPYDVLRPAPDRVEQDPEVWWQGLAAACRRIAGVAISQGLDIQCVGIVGQTPTQVLLDDRGRPVLPALSWQDQRAKGVADDLLLEFGQRTVDRAQGVNWPLDASHPLARHVWLQKFENDRFAAAAFSVQPKDYLNFRLCGVVVSDLWCSKGLVNVETGEPSALLTAVGIPSSLAPTCDDPWATAGFVTKDAAALTGLPAGVPVTVGWSDAFAAMLSTGSFSDMDQGFVLTGTSDIVGVSGGIAERAGSRVIAVPQSCVDGMRLAYGPSQAGGQSYAWLRSLSPSMSETSPARIDADTPIFLPHLVGERAPFWSSTSRGAFVGLNAQHGTEDLVAAVMEGVAFANAAILAACIDDWSLESLPASVAISGGPSRNDEWTQIRANVLGRRLIRRQDEEASVRGAAMLALINVGVLESLSKSDQAAVTTEETFHPDPKLHQVHQTRFERFVSVFEALSTSSSVKQREAI